MSALIERLAAQLEAVRDRDGRWHADCPFCGAVGVKGNRPAFHFYLYQFESGASGAQCWSCGYKSSLQRIARELGTPTYPDDAIVAQRPAAREITPPWRKPRAWENWRRYQSTRIEAITREWQVYRPFTAETVDRYGLAVERMPFYHDERGWYQGRYPRLMIPIVRGDEMLGIRGRAHHRLDDGAKWISATGTQTWLCGLENVRAGDEVIWCESLADRLLGLQQAPKYQFVASGGLTWQAEWLQQLAAARPRYVLVWFDHDLSGNGSPYYADEWRAQWTADVLGRRKNANMPMPSPPTPRGPRLVRELQALGITASLYDWPATAAHKSDMGDVLMADMRA
jgi:hypothetical protein